MDCSVSAAWCLQDEHSDAAGDLLAALTNREAFVPELWLSEMANVLAVAERRDRIDRDDATAAVQLLGRLPVQVVAIGAQALPAILEVARSAGLSAYDATYLELARRLGLPLATFDARLAGSAPDMGLDVLPA